MKNGELRKAPEAFRKGFRKGNKLFFPENNSGVVPACLEDSGSFPEGFPEGGQFLVGGLFKTVMYIRGYSVSGLFSRRARPRFCRIPAGYPLSLLRGEHFSAGYLPDTPYRSFSTSPRTVIPQQQYPIEGQPSPTGVVAER